MDSVARLTVMRGPDEGRAFSVSGDLAHIGRNGSNQVVLSDPTLAEHQASLACRGGRFALYSPQGCAVLVDGAEVPTERWVWLPASAEIGLGLETLVRFEVQAQAVDSPSVPVSAPAPLDFSDSTVIPAAVAPPAPSKEGSSSTVRRRKKKADGKKPAPKFSLDAAGEPRVQLGADGRLPELRLAESTDRPDEDASKKEMRPLVATVAIAGSALLSVLLLFVAPELSGNSSNDRVQARFQLKNFYGAEGKQPEPYQQLLRQAAVEHSQGRLSEERRLYLKVLDLLNSADVLDPRNFHGLTGRQTGRGQNSDKELRELLERLVSRDE